MSPAEWSNTTSVWRLQSEQNASDIVRYPTLNWKLNFPQLNNNRAGDSSGGTELSGSSPRPAVGKEFIGDWEEFEEFEEEEERVFIERDFCEGEFQGIRKVMEVSWMRELSWTNRVRLETGLPLFLLGFGRLFIPIKFCGCLG